MNFFNAPKGYNDAKMSPTSVSGRYSFGLLAVNISYRIHGRAAGLHGRAENVVCDKSSKACDQPDSLKDCYSTKFPLEILRFGKKIFLLSVFCEANYRLNENFSLNRSIIISHFDDQYQVSRLAAIPSGEYAFHQTSLCVFVFVSRDEPQDYRQNPCKHPYHTIVWCSNASY